MKRRWQTPELVILFRGRPEESVLCLCKHASHPPVNPGSQYGACKAGYCNCDACYSTSSAS